MQSQERRTNQIDPTEILDLGDYERGRTEIRASAIAARSTRRIQLGPNATVTFENRETVRYQIQEMLRAERIARPAEVQHEIGTYSDLLPSSSELSATLMFEFPEPAERAVHLSRLIGFEENLFLDVEGAGRARAVFDRRQIGETRLSSVQFVRFPLSAAQKEAFLGAAVALVCDHPAYAHRSWLTPETKSALAADLADAETADG